MTLVELLTILSRQRISLRVDNGKLHFESKKRLPAHFVDGLRMHKSSILKTLDSFEGRDLLLAPLSFNQQSLWLTHEATPSSSAYNVVLPLHILSPVEIENTRKFVDYIVAKHAQLRAVFRPISDSECTVPCQIVPKETFPDFTMIDGTSWSQSRVDEEIDRFAKGPFNLSKNPPYRTLCLKFGTETYLVFVFHHIIVDAISLGLFFREFAKFFENSTTVETPPCPYTDFAVSQLAKVNQNSESWLAYFEKRTALNACISLAVDTPNNAQNRHGKSLYFDLFETPSINVKERCQSWSITPYSFFLGCFQLLCAIRSKQSTIRNGVLFSGRDTTRYKNTIGYFVTPLPITIDVDKNETISNWFTGLYNDILQTADMQHCPFLHLVEKLQNPSGYGRTPIFCNLFNMLNKKQLGNGLPLLYPTNRETDISVGNLRIKPYPIYQQEGQFDLTLELIERDHGVQGIFKYDAARFTTDEIHQLVDTYRDVVTTCIEKPPTFICELFDTLDDLAAVRVGYRNVNVTIAATYTANILEDYLALWKTELGLKTDVQFAPYAQIEQPLISFRTDSGPNDIQVLLIRLEDLWHENTQTAPCDFGKIENRIDEIASFIKAAVKTGKGRVILMYCPPSAAVSSDRRTRDQLADIEHRTARSLKKIPNIIVRTSDALLDTLSSETSYEPEIGIIGHVPYTEPFFATIANHIIRLIYACYKAPCKAIITDCDHTLWEGVAGEDTLNDIRISEPSKAIQRFLKGCAKQGILIALASKNNREDTMAVISQHPDMVLGLDDISFDRINWKPKSENIHEIFKEANLTPRGVVFIDDNPTECAEVQAHCPEVTVVHLPQHVESRPLYLKHHWAFDTLGTTQEDAARIAMYREETARKSFCEQAASFSEYLDRLDLNVVIRPPEAHEIARMSQLSYRTNQFTLGAKRRNEQAFIHALKTDDVFIVRVSDRFGDYGLVGVVTGSSNADVFRIDDFFLSCRALGRGVEYQIWAFLGQHAVDNGCTTVALHFEYTGKNLPMSNFLRAVSGNLEDADASKKLVLPATLLTETVFDPNHVNPSNLSAPSKAQLASPDVPNMELFPRRLLDKAARLSSDPKIIQQGILTLRKRKTKRIEVKKETSFPVRPPSGQYEAELLAIWYEALGRDDVTVKDNFFDAGGRSILLPHIVERIQSRLKKQVSLVDLFHFTTIETLAAKLREENGSKKENSAKQVVGRQRRAFSKFKKKYANR